MIISTIWNDNNKAKIIKIMLNKIILIGKQVYKILWKNKYIDNMYIKSINNIGTD